MKKANLTVAISILSLIVLESCLISGKTKLPESVTSADILYYSILGETKDQIGEDFLGYYRLDNQEGGSVELDSRHPIYPNFLDSSTIVFLDKAGYYGIINGDSGKIVIVSNDSEKYCGNLYGRSIYPYKGNIAFLDGYSISLINSSDCKVLKTLLSQQDLINANKEMHFNPQYVISSFAISPDGSYLIFSSDSNLYKFSVADKKFEKYNKNVIQVSSIAPDQSWVTYIASDGIHILSIDGSKDMFLIACRSSISDSEGMSVVPLPQWSPDSRSIIYHKCINQSCSEITDYEIYIYNLDTKKETRIISAGLFPSWNYYK
jgi:Tol biopolymer transport system component